MARLLLHGWQTYAGRGNLRGGADENGGTNFDGR
jgi:hypothetical protein